MVLSFLKSSGGYRWGLSQREGQGNAPEQGCPQVQSRWPWMTGDCQSPNHQDSSFGHRPGNWTDTWSYQLGQETPFPPPLPHPTTLSWQTQLTVGPDFFHGLWPNGERRGSWWPGSLQSGQVWDSLRGPLDHWVLCQALPRPPCPRPAPSSPTLPAHAGGMGRRWPALLCVTWLAGSLTEACTGGLQEPRTL